MNSAAFSDRNSPNTAALVKAFDWSKTTLGSLERWPVSVSSVVSMMLASPHAMVTLWGPDGIMIYNDAYAHIRGSRHPELFGMPARDAWPEVSEFNDQVMKTCFSGESLSCRNQEMVLLRSSRPETVWLNLDYWSDDAIGCDPYFAVWVEYWVFPAVAGRRNAVMRSL